MSKPYLFHYANNNCLDGIPITHVDDFCWGRVQSFRGNINPLNRTKYSRMDQVKFAGDSLQKIMVCLRRPYHIKFFKGCLPQISLGPFLNTLS